MLDDEEGGGAQVQVAQNRELDGRSRARPIPVVGERARVAVVDDAIIGVVCRAPVQNALAGIGPGPPMALKIVPLRVMRSAYGLKSVSVSTLPRALSAVSNWNVS